jgi:TetR/AcrR family transcriptional repressor of nem operon
MDTTTGRARGSGGGRREELVGIAYRHIAERGFEGLRFRDVAGEAGINNATLLYYFPSKEALIQAVLERMLAEYTTLDAPRPPAGTAGALAELRVEFAEARASLDKAPEQFVVFTELLLRSRRDAAVAALLERLTSRWREHVLGIVGRGIREGVFRPDLDPATVTALIMAQLQGIRYQLLAGGGVDGGRLVDLVEAHMLAWLTGNARALEP